MPYRMKTNQIPECILCFLSALSKKGSNTALNTKKKGVSLCEAKELLKGPGGQVSNWRSERERFVEHPRETGEGGMIS